MLTPYRLLKLAWFAVMGGLLAILTSSMAAAWRSRADVAPSPSPASVELVDEADPWKVLPRASEPTKTPIPLSKGDQVDHTKHQRSIAEPVRRPAPSELPIDGAGRVQLSWDTLAATTVSKRGRPTFSPPLSAAQGKIATLVGYMYPLDEIGDVHQFILLEAPVGCYFCQTPPPTGVVRVMLEGNRRLPIRYEPVKVTGRLAVQTDNPEDFFYSLDDATIASAD